MRRLGKLCDVSPGKTPSKAAYTSSGDIKIVKFRDVLETGEVDYCNDDEGWFDSRYADDSDLVDLLPETILLTNAAHSTEHIGKKVAYVESMPDIANRVCYVGELTGIRSKTESLSTKWLFYWLQTSDAKKAIVRAVEGAHLVPREFKRTDVPEFSESEQDVHLAALDSVDSAIAKAKVELEATRELKRSLMQTLFVSGMPGRHSESVETKIGLIPKVWEVKRIGRVLIEAPIAGTSPQSRPEPPGTPILNVSCIKGGVCDPTQVTYVDVTEEDIERYRAAVEDFYVLRGNGNRDYVATGGLLREAPPDNSIYSDKLIRLRFDPEKVAPRFIPYMWQSHPFLTRLQSKAESGSGLWMMYSGPRKSDSNLSYGLGRRERVNEQ